MNSNLMGVDVSSSAVLAASRITMPVIMQQTQLEKMLSDEKIRSLQHKENYQKLKTEHKNLQDECLNLETQLKSSYLDKTNIDDNYQTLLATARTEIATRQAECYHLKDQAMSKEKLDLLRMRIVEELEPIYGSKVKQLLADNETQAAEMTRLKYEHQFLQSEYDNEKEQFARVTSEMRIRHDAEIVNMRRERESIIAEHSVIQSTQQGDAQRVRCLARENDHLHLKVKSLTEELEEIRKQKDASEITIEMNNRTQMKQITETTAALKSSKAEFDSLRLQLESQGREMINLEEMKSRSSAREHALKQELILQNGASDETRHRFELDSAAAKMFNLKERIEIEKERDNQRTIAEEMACQVETLQSIIRNQTVKLEEKEREIIAVNQTRNDYERQRISELENNKIELENRLSTVTKTKSERELKLDAELSELNERFRKTDTARNVAIKEASVSKVKLAQHQVVVEQLERERNENSDMKTRLSSIENLYRNYIANKQELNNKNDLLKKQLKELTISLDEKDKSIIRDKTAASENFLQSKTTWTDERFRLQTRIAELDEALKQCSSKLATSEISNKQQYRKLHKVLNKLKVDRKTLTLKYEHMQAENISLKKTVIPNEERTKKQLKDLWRRHQEFNGIIMSDNNFSASNAMSEKGDIISRQANISKSIFDMHLREGSIISGDINDDEYIAKFNKFDSQQNDLQMLKDRLNKLDNNQRQQMSDLQIFQHNLISNISTEEKV